MAGMNGMARTGGQTATGAPEEAQMQRFMQMMQGLQNPQQRQQYAMQLAQQMPAPPPEAMQGFQPMLPGQVPQVPQQFGGLIGGQQQMPPPTPSLGQFMTPDFVPQGVQQSSIAQKPALSRFLSTFLQSMSLNRERN